MTKLEKLIRKILSGSAISYDEAEKVLLKLGFELEISGSHHIFRREGYYQNISIKKRSQLLPYQMKLLRDIIKDCDE